MELKLFKTLWGYSGSYQQAIAQARQAGFNGIEGPLPTGFKDATELRQATLLGTVDYIAELCTAGSYVPDRLKTLEQHLDDVSRFLDQAMQYNPLFVTCLGGCDAWPLAMSVEFFGRAMELAKAQGIVISFETHRGRSLFNPWVTQQVIHALPDIRLTCDFSHWCVVCERLIDSELEVIHQVARHAHHIHARVGYDQGPQVPHPAAPEYQSALQAHQNWWQLIWQSQQVRGYQQTTMTPEFGPDGYLQKAPFTQQPVADLWQINCWMADTEKRHFAAYAKQLARH